MLLTFIPIAPVAASLANLLPLPRRMMSLLSTLAFGATLELDIELLRQVLAHGVVTEWNEFFYADALSAWMVLLISVVSFGSSLYAGSYFHRDPADGAATSGRAREFFVLTPLFGAGMFLVVLANTLGIMLAAVAAMGLSPFGLFFSELIVISDGIAAGKTMVSLLILIALIASFCGVLQRLTRILPDERKHGLENKIIASPFACTCVMALLLGALLVFSVWLPAPLLQGIQQVAGIIGEKL